MFGHPKQGQPASSPHGTNSQAQDPRKSISQKKPVKFTGIHIEQMTVSEFGVTETVVTKTLTDHFVDGTTSIRKETRITRDEENKDGVESSPVGTLVGETSVPKPSPAPPPPPKPADGKDVAKTKRPDTTRTSESKGKASVLHMAPKEPVTNDQWDRGVTQKVKDFPTQLKTDDSFIQEALMCHNRYRVKHGVPPLMLSLDLCKLAQSWADELAEKGVMQNSHYGYGENIYWSSDKSPNMRGDVPVEYWYNEQAMFDWQVMDFQHTTGSFTQVIWKDSKKFGIAKQVGDKGAFVVAFYLPPGNILGKFKENVFKAAQASSGQESVIQVFKK